MSTMSKLGYVDVSDNRLQGTVPANVVAWGVAPLYVPALLHPTLALLLRPPTHTRNQQHLYLATHPHPQRTVPVPALSPAYLSGIPIYCHEVNVPTTAPTCVPATSHFGVHECIRLRVGSMLREEMASLVSIVRQPRLVICAPGRGHVRCWLL
jgi:hypothetical protein